MRLLLLEDDHTAGTRLCAFLRGDGHVVDWCTTLGQASVLAAEPYDAWLLDGTLPDGSSVDWLLQMRSRGVAIPAVGLADRDSVSDRIQALDSGADDLLVKPFDPRELCARLRAIARRIAGTAQRAIFDDVEIDLTARGARAADQPVDLTAREWAILEALVLRAGRIVPKAELESLVLGIDGEIASNSIEVHVCNLRRKLGRALIETIRGLGYRMRTDSARDVSPRSRSRWSAARGPRNAVP